jgi:hypothetical protein
MCRVKRWLVVFRSDASPTGAVDATAFDVRAASHLEAIASILRDDPPQHPWGLARAVPWPRGVRRSAAGLAAIA